MLSLLRYVASDSSSKLEMYRVGTLNGSYARLVAHAVVAGGAIIGVHVIEGKGCNGEICESVFAQIFIVLYAILELLGLPVDIYNIKMADPSKNLEYDKSAMIINGFYMTVNLIVMAITSVFLISVLINVTRI